MKSLLIAFVIIVIQIYRINGSVYEYQLINDLFQNYSTNVRPAINHLDPTKVYISAGLSQIIDVNDKDQIITAYLWIAMFWFDPMLTWNPANYNNLTDIVVSASDVWKPDISMNQAAEKVIVNSDYENVRINYQGTVNWSPNGAFKLYCQINTNYLPFDEQTCGFSFISQSFSIYQLDLVIYGDLIMSFYVNNTEWDFVNTTSKKTFVYDGIFPVQIVTFFVHIRRKPLYDILTYMSPCLVTLAVSFLAFFVPAESGEKMSISITCLLSLIVLLLVVSDILPPSNSSFPLIGLFYFTSIAINALISLTSVVILNIHHYGANGKPVPIKVQKIFFSLLGKIILFPKINHIDGIRSKATKSEDKNQSTVHFEKNEDKKDKGTDCSKSVKDFFSRMSRSNKIANTDLIEVEEIDKEQAQLQWTLLGDIIERLLFYVFLVLTIFVLLGVISVAPSAKIFTK